MSSEKSNKARQYAKDMIKARANKEADPDYHKYGLPISIASDVKDYVDDLWDAVTRGMDVLATNSPHLHHVGHAVTQLAMNDYKPEGDLVLDHFHEAWEMREKSLLNEAIVIPPPMGQMITHIVKPETASYVVAGAALGISLESFYHIFQGLWSRLKDLYDGRQIKKKEMIAYAAEVKRHVNKKTQVMINDLRIALDHSDWIKAAQIAREIKAYGERVGLTPPVQEDAGAVASALPANNVGSGHIAGAAGDPPGPRSKLFRKVVRRKKIV